MAVLKSSFSRTRWCSRSTVELNSTALLMNTGATLNVRTGSTLGTVALSGTIAGDTIHDAASGFVFAGVTLEDVKYEGTLGVSAEGANLSIADGITLTGTKGTGAGTLNLTGTESFLFVDNTTMLDNAMISLGNAAHLESLDFTGTVAEHPHSASSYAHADWLFHHLQGDTSAGGDRKQSVVRAQRGPEH